MSEPKGLSKSIVRLIVFGLIAVGVVSLVIRNIAVWGNILLVVLGFGAVIIIHEFGHFIVAKLSGIKVEAFSLFMPPVLFGIKRTEQGWRVRILPEILPKEEDDSGDGLLSFTVGKKAKAGETEYRIGLIPLGGFVKMLGQDDIGPDRHNDDPRSFANKPIAARMAVIAAGVSFNILSAIVIFMVVFLVGIRLVPAVVGDVLPDSPAARAGLKAGDEIIAIGGEDKYLDFYNVAVAAALSDTNEPVAMTVRHRDGSVQEYSIAAEQPAGETPRGEQVKRFGISPELSMTVAPVSDVNALEEATGLRSGDTIRSVNGKEVESYHQFEQIVREALTPDITVLAGRKQVGEVQELFDTRLKLVLLQAERRSGEPEASLLHICSMVPRLRIEAVAGKGGPAKGGIMVRVRGLLVKIGIRKAVEQAKMPLQAGDVIVAAGGIEDPTYSELREVTQEYEGRELSVEVLRADANGSERRLSVTVEPRRPAGSERVVIGIVVSLDGEDAVVAKTISGEDGAEPLAIPRGARITAVDGAAVSSFYDVMRQVRLNEGQRITIDWRLSGEVAGDVGVEVGKWRDSVTVRSALVRAIPFGTVERLYRAAGPVEAVVIGYKKTVMFVEQTYITVMHLVRGLLSPKTLMGPVGILTLSYRVVATQPLVYYVYLLGLISACIAVVNFLPLPPLDGGLIVLLLIEKVKGSALGERTQGIIAYTGWVLIGALFIYLTFNDVVNYILR